MDKTAELIAKKYGRDGASVVKSYQGLNFSKQIQFIVDNCSCETAEVLDVGCGTGAFVVQAAIKGLEVTGIDTFQESDGMDLKIALSRVAELDINIRTQFVGGSALNLPFPDHSFDVVTTFGMYEHLLPDRRQGALKEMYRVLRPGGFIFFVAGPTVFNPIDQHIPWLPFANWLPRRIKLGFSTLIGRRQLLEVPWKVSRREIYSALPDGEFVNWYGRYFMFDGEGNAPLSWNPMSWLVWCKRNTPLGKAVGALAYLLAAIGLEHSHILKIQKGN